MKWSWGKTHRIRCPDGTERIVHKNVDDAFPLHIPGWTAKTGAEADYLKQVSGKLSAEYATEVKGLLYSLDEQNQSLMMGFRAVYIMFQSNPCGNADSLRRQIEKMIDDQQRLTAIRIQMRTVIELATNRAGDPTIITAFREIAGLLGNRSQGEIAAKAIDESREAAHRWIEGGR